jgi:SOS response regulatory protein OraA/RecX
MFKEPQANPVSICSSSSGHTKREDMAQKDKEKVEAKKRQQQEASARKKERDKMRNTHHKEKIKEVKRNQKINLLLLEQLGVSKEAINSAMNSSEEEEQDDLK